MSLCDVTTKYVVRHFTRLTTSLAPLTTTNPSTRYPSTVRTVPEVRVNRVNPAKIPTTVHRSDDP